MNLATVIRVKRKFLFPLCCAAAAMPITGSAATNPEPPPGSYTLTCSNIQTDSDGDTLSADCEKLGGSPIQGTTLSGLNQCLSSLTGGGDIANIDGNLVCMPDLPLPSRSMQFPMPETVINDWIYSNDQNAINRHGWEIWAGLTAGVGVVDGIPMRAFETWATPAGMIYQTKTFAQPGLKLFSAPPVTPDNGLQLGIPRQFHGRDSSSDKPIKAAFAEVRSNLKASPVGDTSIFESVAYNPAAAQHAVANRLFLKSTLNALVEQGYSDIPTFPVGAITIKPVYKVIPADTPNGIYTFPGWPGTPSPAKAFPEPDWGACVYVNVNGSGPGTGSAIDKGCSTRAKPAPQYTFHVDDFIHEILSAEDARYLNQQLGLSNAKAGDIAILVGMHVTSREIKRWTWQTFWWSADADNPYLPSSSAIADQRPLNVLDHAAAHYAMATAYQMIAPAQPIAGGQSVGQPHIAYNPHLEAGFDPTTFQVHRAIKSDQPGQPAFEGNCGVQTNCMTCHNLAAYTPPNSSSKGTGYATDFYMGLDDPIFEGLLRTDFAWSIPDNATD